jgi:hypothetical protein
LNYKVLEGSIVLASLGEWLLGYIDLILFLCYVSNYCFGAFGNFVDAVFGGSNR